MKKKIAVTMGLAAVALTGGVVLVSMEDDKKGPDIIFESQPVYTGEEDVSYLLEGVKAVDLKDEDVTDSLRVENVQVKEEEQNVVIVYIAKDRSNNVTKVSITVPSNGIKNQAEESLGVSMLEEKYGLRQNRPDAAQYRPSGKLHRV